MKSFLLAAIGVIAIAIASAFVLNDRFQMDSATAFTTEGARITPADQISETN
jgi:hypothetical protein